MAVVVTFVMAWAAMVVWPDVPVVQRLRAWLIVHPAARLSAIRRGDVAVGIVIVAAVIVMSVCEDSSAGRLFLYAMPDAVIWLTTIELSAVVDALVAVAVAFSAWRGGGAGVLVRRLPARRAHRAARTRPKLAPANDDEDHRRFAVA
ncbi:hypothetical protein [Sphingomonas sp.]|uniref:hypothetical protein n=1 Tax=Sphingomonas sp. TaxID=28214 RepID=UPI00286F723A|nr:hypothetical protein [Sphingomonas sp.]